MSALDRITSAVGEALAEHDVQEVLAVMTGCFVGLTVELVRRNGGDPAMAITLDGGKRRDVTIHAEKATGATP